MGIKQNAKIRELKKQNSLMDTQILKYKQVQETLVKDILTLREYETAVRGNDYPEYGPAVQAISDKYNNKAVWGCMQTGIIIDLRSAFILGEGVKIHPTTDTKEEAEKELQWSEDFLDYNDLDAEMAQEIAKEAEIEGKIALELYYDKEKYKEWPGMISARYISWSSKKYEVKTDPKDYLKYETLEWTPTEGDSVQKLKEEQFVYKKFGGRLNKPNEAQPKIVRALTPIDKMDKALWDLRRLNHLFASQTPNFECEDPKQVTKIIQYLEDINWKIGKAIVHTAKFSMVGPDTSGVSNLIEEIVNWGKVISGITGIPIHYLGFLDLLKNRATGENTRELIMAVTERERTTWRGAYEELLMKAMNMFNEKVNKQRSKEKKLDPYKVKVTIPHITQEHWDRIEKVLIPAAAVNIVSKEHVASQIPGVDMQEEAARSKERETKDNKKAKQEFERIKVGINNEEEEEEEE